MRIPPVRIEFSKEGRGEVLRRIDLCLARRRLAQAENVEGFAEAFARYVDARQAGAGLVTDRDPGDAAALDQALGDDKLRREIGDQSHTFDDRAVPMDNDGEGDSAGIS